MKKELSIILPSYKEAENLRILLPQLQSTLGDLHIAYEILVVDTEHSMDTTKEVCDMPHVRYINRQGGNNYGDAIRTGIMHAEGIYTVFMDADGSHTPEFIKTLYSHRNDGDVIIASRYIEGGTTDNSKSLIYMSLVLNIIYAVVLGLRCKDVSNSFKLYKTEDLKKINLYCNNFDIVEEILFKLKRLHKKLIIKELPFTFKKRMFGETKRNLVFFILSYIVTLVRLRFSK
jgi:dolichol-phosphate mannosyltransferase